MEYDSCTLIFDDANAIVRKIDESHIIFTEGIEEVVTTHFRNGRENRFEILTLLGKAYENNYVGFIK